MAVLNPTELTGQVIYLGINPSREGGHVTQAVDRVVLTFEGIEGEAHSGLTRRSCARVTRQYDKGTEIRNTRQISILSREDLAHTANSLGIPELKPEWVGASIVFEGLPDLTLLPPSSRLIFDGGVSLTVDMENAPCTIISREIERHHPGKGKDYRAAALHFRGVTAWVERPGEIGLGEVARLHVPPQRLYPPLA
ncbi:MOSC domain-containing protein [Amaricoccus macauensis]|uniref:MOSC domain-containing protein n=1 Tax=Amaricoccus macauensis TaxID=57001 RepID=UPI003C7D289C